MSRRTMRSTAPRNAMTTRKAPTIDQGTLHPCASWNQMKAAGLVRTAMKVVDRLKGVGVGFVLVGAAMLGLVGAARAFPDAWPVVAGVGAALLVLLLSFVAPVVLEPIFNRFRPLADERLAGELRELADRAGVPVRDALDVSRAGDPGVVPFAIFLFTLLDLAALPFGATLSRRFERTADRFSLELTGDEDAYESTHLVLARENLADLDPPRLYHLALHGHPTAPARIAAGRAWKRARPK